MRNLKNFYLFAAIVIVLHINNFFLDTYIILKSNVEKRLTKVYGYCENESFGFINKILNSSNSKYNIKYNIKVLHENDNFSFNNSSWFYYKTNKQYNTDKIILINNKNSLKLLNDNQFELTFQNNNLGSFKIIEQFDNCFFLDKS